MKKITILFLALLSVSQLFAQSSNDETQKLILGNWILSKTTSVYDGKNGITEIATGTCLHCEKINFKNDHTVEVNNEYDLKQNYQCKIVGNKIFFDGIAIQSNYKFFKDEYLIRFTNAKKSEVEFVNETGKEWITLEKQ